MTPSYCAAAPASIGNLGVGFDILGAAVARVDGGALGDRVHAHDSARTTFRATGPYANALPHDPADNLVVHAYDAYVAALAARSIAPRPLALVLDKQLPVGSGLGSSACSSVAALVAINAAHGDALSANVLLRLMGALEGRVSGSVHYDNVAPSFLGGVQLLVDAAEQLCVPVPWFDDWLLVLTHPGIAIATADARAALPAQVPLGVAVEHGRLVAGFVHACHVGDRRLAAALLRDVLAEPTRARLLPRFDEVRAAALDAGALAVGLSGSGPTVFSVVPNAAVGERVAAWQRTHWNLTGSGFTHLCRVGGGATVSREEVPA